MIDFLSFIGRLKYMLEQPLPGKKAHELLMAEERKEMLMLKPDLKIARKAAVLVLFYPENDQPHIVFIERTKYKGVHSGQIAFPGGQYESQDNNLHDTAVRETEEETGVGKDTINIIGGLSEIYIPPSNYNVLPVVGWIDYKPDFIPDKSEVENVITFAVDSFFNENALKSESIISQGRLLRNVPCYKIDEYIIWGATSMILSELMSVMNPCQGE